MRSLALLLLTIVVATQGQTPGFAVPPKPSKTPATTAADDCIVETADIGFIVDASGSVDATEWQQSLEFAAKVVEGYDIAPNKVRVGLIGFSDMAYTVFNFNTYSTKAQVLSAIRGASKVGGLTATHLALNMARDNLFQQAAGMRPGVPNILFVITDGQSNSRPDTLASAKTLHDRNITVFAVGVSGAVLDELQGIATKNEYVYNFQDFSRLALIQKQFNKETCKVAVKLAPTTIPTTTTTTPTTTTTTPTTTSTTPMPTTTKPCVVETADIAFLVDASGSVDSTEWRQSLEFASKVISAYDIGPNKVKVGMVGFSNTAYSVFNFNKYTSTAQVVAAIKNARKVSGGTATHLGLNMVRDSLFQASAGMRPGVPNILFVITDGASNSRAQTLASAKTLHNRGITVFAVGVSGANTAELNGIASKPEYVYNFKDFTKLAIIQQQFNKETCKVAVKLATNPPPTTPGPFAGCKVNAADIVFVVDTSTSVGLNNFNTTKIFLSDMVDQLDFSKIRVGLIKFNDRTTPEFELNKYTTAADAKAHIQGMTYDQGKGTVISGALKHMREVSFTAANGDRPLVPNLAILVTDGQGQDTFRTQYEGNKTKDAGIEIFSVGIGNDINEKELRSLASDPSFVNLVKTFGQLTSIQLALASQLCQGFTLPPTTPPAPCLCKDTDDACHEYDIKICYEARYRRFAEEKCAVFCDVCPAGCIKVYPPPKPCVDAIPDCDRKIDVCTDMQFRPYAVANCPRYCNLCEFLNPTGVIQTTTPIPPTTTPTTTIPTTTGPPTPTTPFVPCDPNCHDSVRNCKDYDKSTCRQPRFEGFFRASCSLYCGFCTEKPSCVTQGPCVDIEDCSKYTDSTCVQYPEWAKATCPRRCGLCPGQIKVTVPPVKVCEDKEDCTKYGKDMCTDYLNYAKENCPLYCDFCQSTVSTTKAPCVDKEDCTKFNKSACREPDYRKFMLATCRLWCNACDDEV